MLFRVIAKRYGGYGDSVEFELEAANTKEALQKAKAMAAEILGYKAGDAGAPTVSLKPVVPDDK